MKKYIILFALIFILSLNATELQAQCAMCTVNAEQGVQNGNTQGKGLNTGILYLLVIPYLMVASMGIIWYTRYRKKQNQPKSFL